MDSNLNCPFILHWVWGHQSSIAAINLSTQKKKEIFYASGHVGVCYNWIKNKQSLLLGHKNEITSIAASPDKRYLASVDSGTESSLIIWHADDKSIFHLITEYFSSEAVVISMCFSPEDDKLMALSGRNPQQISIWDWKNKKMLPDFIYKYKENAEFQHFISFHSVFSSHFTSCGNKNVYFFERVDKENIKTAILNVKNLHDDKAANQMGNFTQTAFTTTSSLAASATTRGMIVLWGRPLYSKEKPARDSKEWFVMSPDQRVCIRVIQVMESKCPISFLSAYDNYIVAGTAESELICYDEDFSIQWSSQFHKGHINGISFAHRPQHGFKSVVKKLLGKVTESHELLLVKDDFIICTVEGYVGYYSVVSNHLEQILWGTNQLLKSITVHPLWTYIYFGDYSGGIQKWNYSSKELINEDKYESSCSKIEFLVVDNKEAYIACVMSNGNLVIFDAVCFSSKACFTANEVLHKPTMIHFSPDSQHLLIIDVSSYVTHYRLQLLVVPKVYQMMHKKNVPAEEPFWKYGGKTRQHQGRIVDSMFNIATKNEALMFYTLGEDRYLVQYNISSSKDLNIDVSKRINLERKPIPTCMAWYPQYDVFHLIAVLNDDGKMRIYSTGTEKIVRIVSLPVYEEPIKRIIFQAKLKYMMNKEFPNYTNIKDVFQYFIFFCSHMIGLSKFPIDGNPNTSLGLTSSPSGINSIVSNKDQTYLFTTGKNDCWVFMYEINIMALLEAEREGGEGIEAFKYLFPSDLDPDEMKKKLIYSVYSLELEMKMLKFGIDDSSSLKGEIPINCLQYVLATLGCFIAPSELQLMLKDIEFENKYLYDGKKKTVNCLDIMKLYVNYRPCEPVTKSKLKETFNSILMLEEDPDQITRSRLIEILTTRGDAFSHSELLEVLKCLKSNGNVSDAEYEDSSDENVAEAKEGNGSTEIPTTILDKAVEELKELVPDHITEDIFFREVLCLESAEEDLSKYVLKKEDYKRVQEYPKLEEFVEAIENKENEF